MWVIFYEQQKEESCQPSGCKIFFSLVIEKYQIDILTNDTNVCKTFKATPEINQNYDLFPIRSNKALMKFKWEQTFISKYFWTKSRRKLIPLLIVPSFLSHRLQYYYQRSITVFSILHLTLIYVLFLIVRSDWKDTRIVWNFFEVLSHLAVVASWAEEKCVMARRFWPRQIDNAWIDLLTMVICQFLLTRF